MNKNTQTSINEELVNKVLINPIHKGANKLIIITGYASHNMASWHMKKINKENVEKIKISLIVGMGLLNGISISTHEGMKELTNFKDEKYPSFNCQYIYQGAPVHSKIYLWLKNEKPFIAYTGSANYTQNGFSTQQREYVIECDPDEAYNYYTDIEGDSIVCNHNEIEEYICLKKDQYIEDFEYTRLYSEDSVTLSLLTCKGEAGHGSGINWGIRKNGTKREPNQAYISIPAKIARSGFFPLNEAHFTAITDDHKQLILRIEQDGDKALTTPLNNSLLGEYLRNRIGVSNGAFVTKEDLERYGRTDVTFYKIDEEHFYMDFSI